MGNPKQTHMKEIPTTETLPPRRSTRLEFWILIVRACFGLRMSNFGSWICSSFLVLSLLACGGCETPPSGRQVAAVTPQTVEHPPAVIPTGFGPAKISLLPLSEITGAADIGQDARLNVYVALLDAFGCPMKAPCTLRFELYEHVLRSAQAKGPRLMIWPDIDLTHPADNQKAWRDFLRAYEFQFPFRADHDKTYVLEATYRGSDGKRLSGECAIRADQ